MCFHTATISKTKRLEKHFGVKLSNEDVRSVFDQPQYHLNGFAHPNMLVIPQQKPEVLAPGVWGIVPNNKTPDQIKRIIRKQSNMVVDSMHVQRSYSIILFIKMQSTNSVV